MNNKLQSELVRPMEQQASGLNWTPTPGEQTLRLLATIPPESKGTVAAESIRILGRCNPPSVFLGKTTGLVVGYVQSGKTLSFTAVTALARDNGYKMVIVITGISKPLFNQSADRLHKDLGIDSRENRVWQHFRLPKGDVRMAIETILSEWSNPQIPADQRQSVLITVMKNHTHLRNLIAILRQLDLHDVPVLVIDDEADQAGLNIKVSKGGQSPTYSMLMDLRSSLPHHSFLQYTATPQAPLLINLIDNLSPDFAETLTPGPTYVGGKEFFVDEPHLVRVIPNRDIQSRQNVLREAPASLLTAMRIYFLGVAAGYVLNGGKGNRSMLVHSAREVSSHDRYYIWVTNVRDAWRSFLNAPPTDPDRQDLINEFKIAYDDLAATAPDLPSFDVLVSRLPSVLGRTSIKLVNTNAGTDGKTPVIDWSAAYPFILVGGQAMDRGFTVEGLTVTYMPRDTGTGNADTVQQRARFFGYKLDYLGYCRVFLEGTARDAYERYVQHEEDIRTRLLQHSVSGSPLSEWKRAFFLTKALRPTRDSVIQLGYVRGNYEREWYHPRALQQFDPGLIAENRATVGNLTGSLNWTTKNYGGTDAQTHEHAQLPLQDLFRDLLVEYKVANSADSLKYFGLLLQVSAYLETHPLAEARVYRMSPNYSRVRSVDDHGQLRSLFESRDPKHGYPGDSEIRIETMLNVHIYDLSLRHEKQVFATNFPVLAIWLPQDMDNDWLVQNQGGNHGGSP